MAVTAAESMGVTTVVLGDPKGTADKTRKQLNREARQKMAQMESGSIKDYLKYNHLRE
jgi:hypothetical protein